MNEKPFWQILDEQVALRSGWTDAAILDELRAIAVLPDEYEWFGKTGLQNPVWQEPETIEQLTTYLVIARLVAERKLREGVALLLERASYGDFGETMRGLRHSLEAAYKPDWKALGDICLKAAHSSQRGARLWAIGELGVLHDQRAIPILFEAVHDPATLIRNQAVLSLWMLTDVGPEIKEEIVVQLRRLLRELKDTQLSVENVLDELCKSEGDSESEYGGASD